MVSAPLSAATVAVVEALEARERLALLSDHLDTLACRPEGGPFEVEVCQAGESVWALFKRGDNSVAWRLAHFWGAGFDVDCNFDKGICSIELKSALGTQRIRLEKVSDDPVCFRARTELELNEPLVVSRSYRDLYLLGTRKHPEGSVHATQRGLNAGVAHLRFEGFGGVFYFQDFTELQDYFRALECGPEGAVRGRWPEFGYAAPINTERSLPAGKLTIASGFLWLETNEPRDPQAVSEQFNRALAGIYPHLNRPETLLYDWPERAKRTLKDLQE